MITGADGLEVSTRIVADAGSPAMPPALIAVTVTVEVPSGRLTAACRALPDTDLTTGAARDSELICRR